MKWFYLILVAAAVAAFAISVERISGTPKSALTQAIIAVSIGAIVVGLLKLLSKMRE